MIVIKENTLTTLLGDPVGTPVGLEEGDKLGLDVGCESMRMMYEK